MDKKNIKKLIIKFKSKLMPLTMALLVAVSSLAVAVPAEAKEVPVYAKKLEVGVRDYIGFKTCSPSFHYEGMVFELHDSVDDVYILPLLYKANSSYYSLFFCAVSTSSFSLNYSSNYDCGSEEEFLQNVDSSSLPYSSTFTRWGVNRMYYIAGMSVSRDTSIYTISGEYVDMNSILGQEYIDSDKIGYLFDELYEIDMQIGTETIETNYAGSSTAEILPPQDVSFYNDKTYNTEDSFTQIQWTCPNDDTLKMEIACEVYWREGVFGKKNYDTYFWKTYDNSDIPGTYHKYSFRQNQPCLDYFSENGIDVPKFYNVTYWYLRWARCDDSGNVTYSLWTKLDPKFDYIPEYVEDGIILDSIEGNTTLFGKDIGDNSTWAETGEFDVDSGSWVPKHVYVDSNGDSVIMSGSEKAPATSPGLDSSGNNLAPSHNELTDIIPENFGDVFNSFNDYLESAWDFLGDFPSYLGDLMTFLPSGITVMLGLGIVMAIMLRLLGR